MRRAVNLTLYYGLLSISLLGLLFASRQRLRFALLSVVVALAVYAAATFSHLRWSLPRRRRHVASFAVCFLGAFLASLATLDPAGQGMAVSLIAAAAGAFGFLFAAVKTGVPTHVGIVVNTGSVSAHWRDGAPDAERGRKVANEMHDLGSYFESSFAESNFGVWPEHFEIAQEGSITWFINGPPGTRATIRFDQGFDPFTEPGGSPSEFPAVVPPVGPGIAFAGPVVAADRGAYSIEIQPPGGMGKKYVVNGGGSQRKG